MDTGPTLAADLDMALAVVSVAVPRFALDDPRMAGFRDGIDRVDLLADESPGFVWRHRGPAGHAALVRAFGREDVLVSLSLWVDYPSLHAFTYRGMHGRYLSERERWFEGMPGPTTALWWMPEGRRPTVDSALGRLALLRRIGPSARAFTVLRRWDASGKRER